MPKCNSKYRFLTRFFTIFINLVIVDDDPILTKDLTLAPPIDYNDYNVNMPIKIINLI